MNVESSQIVNIEIKLDISELLVGDIPTEEDLYKPLQRLIKEMDLFDYLKQLDMDALIGLPGGPKGIRPYTLMKRLYETVPFIGFVSEKPDISIRISPKELLIIIDLEDEVDDEEETKELKETKNHLIEKISTNLKTLIGVLYGTQLLNENARIDIPIKIKNMYEFDIEETRTLLSSFLGAISGDPSIGPMDIENVTVRTGKEVKTGTTLTISKRKDQGYLRSEHSDIIVSLKNLNIDNLIKMNINQTNTIISALEG